MVSVASTEIPVNEESTRDVKILSVASREMVNGGLVCVQEEIHRSIQHQVGTSADVTKASHKAATGKCSMCSNHRNQSVVELCENESLEDLLDHSQPLPIDCIPKYLRSLCVKCVFKINAQKELATQMSISRRLPTSINNILNNHELTSLTTTTMAAMMTTSSLIEPSPDQHVREQKVLSLVPPTPDTSPNTFISGTATTPMPNVNTPSVTPTLESSWHPLTNMNSTSEAACASFSLTVAANEASTSAASSPHSTEQIPLDGNTAHHLSPLMVGTPKSSSSSPSHQVNGNYSMLEVYHECVVSPLTTESGGTKHKRDYARVNRNQNPLICPHCSRTYWRKDYHTKHVRRCNMQRYARSAGSIRSNGNRNRQNRTESPSLSVMTEPGTTSDRVEAVYNTTSSSNNNSGNNNPHDRRKRSRSVGSSRTFVCPTCSLTLNSYSSLKDHRRIHLPRLFCDICGNVFSCLNEFEFHSAICTAKHDMERIASVMKQHELDGITMPPVGRVTRSQSRAAVSQAPTSITERSKRSNRRRVESSFASAPKRRAATSSGINTRRKASSRTIKSCIEDREDSDYNDDEDDVSVTDTMYTKRLRSCRNWVHEQQETQHYSLHPIFYSYEFQENNNLDFQIQTDKEYDLYLLDRLRAEVLVGRHHCYSIDCEYFADGLPSIMVHDYLDHFNGWFHCRKCRGSFTKKLYLDYHQYEQDPGLHICYLCHEVIRYKFAFQKHLIQHQRCVNYRCNYCNTEYLDEAKLIWHCALFQHDPNASPPSRICIDHSMTISNVVKEEEPVLTRRDVGYTVIYKDIKTPPMPSKRCVPMEKYYMSLPDFFTKNAKCIGAIRFEDQRVPNCAMPT